MTPPVEPLAAIQSKQDRAFRVRTIIDDCIGRRATGEHCDDCEVLAANPDLPELAQALAHLRAVERACDGTPQIALSQAHAASAASESQDRLPLRCPQCQSAIAVEVASPGSEVVCPSCGGRFRLIDGDGGARADGPKVIAHFELMERLGVGGFGVVWKAFDTRLARTVALKLPHRGRLAANEVEVLWREARSAAQLCHPGIVQVFEVGAADGTVYVASEFVEGQSLADRLADQRMSAREAAELCRSIAASLQHAHELGVIHRDLKPENILLDRDGQPHVADFGLARRLAGEATLTLDGQLLGTPAYMSPEQARGEAHSADRTSDVYSLGVILFQLLTGELPFRGSVERLVAQIVHDAPPAPRRLNGHVPRDLETISLKCLEKAPAQRYPTALALADDLGRYLRGEPIVARPIGRMARSWRWCKRNPPVAGLTTAVLSLLVTIGVASSLLAWRETIRRREAVAQEQDTYRRLYFSDMHGAAEALADGNVGRVMDLLNRHRPQSGREDLRGFEWYYLWRQCRRGLSQRTLDYGQRVHSLAVSPDGGTIAAGGDGYNIKLWDVDTGQHLTTFSGTNGWVNAVAFSPDGMTLACRTDHSVTIWDLASRALLFTITDDSFANNALAFSRDGRILAAVTDDRSMIRLWDTTALRVPRHDDAAGDNRVTRLWEITTHRELRKIGVEKSPCHGLAFSPRGNLLASGGADGSVSIFDPTSGAEQFVLRGDANYPTPFCFMPEGTTLVSGGAAGTIIVWDLESRAQSRTLAAHSQAIRSLALSANGKLLASASSDGTIKLWDTDRFDEHDKLLGNSGEVLSVGFSRDGRTLAAGGADGTVRLWDLSIAAPRDSLRGHTAGLFCVAVSPDGQRLASGADDGTVKIWEIASGKELHTLAAHTGNVWCLAFDTTGEVLASGGKDRMIRLWDVRTGERKSQLQGHESWVFVVCFTPDGKNLVSASNDQTLRVWDLESLQCGRILRNISGVGAAVSSDGRFVAVDTTDGTVEIRDFHKLGLLRSLTRVEPDVGAESFAFSPDGRTLAWATGAETRDMTVKLWDWASDGELRALVGHTDYVYSVNFSPDGRTLASASYDGTVRLWDVATAVERAALRGHSGHVLSVAFTPDGQTLVSASRDKTVRLWRSASDEEVVAAETADASRRARETLQQPEHVLEISQPFPAAKGD